ncbi:MAG TPA: Verru_Chthon cassette protein A, partial [Candidatus Saccharimonadia bacterium]|nr:Verru_Chthon cassette protein A [Candidatus Saccharimonadia bacterium]
ADGSIPMQISGANVELEIYSGHLGKIVVAPEVAATKVQTLQLGFPANTVKAPTLVRVPIEAIKNNKDKVTDPEVEAPYWWTFYGKGCMGFDVDDLKKGTAQVIGGRFWGSNSEPQNNNQLRRGAFFYGFDPVVDGAPRPFRPKLTPGNPAKGEEAEGSDVVQTLLIKHGDYRLTAASSVVDQSQWKPHRHWGARRLAHNFSNFVSQQMPGYDYGGTADYANRLVPNDAAYAGQKYANNRIPDFPFFTEASSAAHSTWDFDNGIGPARDGPYINKPDEGNLNSRNGLAYYVEAGKQQSTGENFFSPNRQIASPGVLGSLPTGVKAGKPWRTLLFRPQQDHPGGGEAHGGQDPPDHLLLEFFWMPVVEPYAISEPFSTAGKINLNYQIFPFTNIRRASGLHAVLEKERITAVSKADMQDYKAWPVAGNNDTFWKESDGKSWHHKVNIEATLRQFDDRFTKGKAFVTPSEICDIHLVAAGVADADKMKDFWEEHRLTGDNTRERPYANIYPRLTTRSNTFKVHYVAQTITKARSTEPDVVTEADKVTSEYRGSTVIERWLDPARKDLPDFASGFTSDTLDQHHQFRIIETKKFGS